MGQIGIKIKTAVQPRLQKLKLTANDYLSRFRQWQQQPTHYKSDDTLHRCNNCGNEFTGNFCPVCSQHYKHGRITWISIWEHISLLWGLDSRSFPYTIWQLLWRPGYLVRDFISGKRQISYPPVKMLVILSAIVTIIHLFLPEVQQHSEPTDIPLLDFAISWLESHEDIGTLLACSILILPTWLLFRKAPLYPHHTIPEGFILQAYMASIALIINNICPEDSEISSLLIPLYYFITYKQLFGYKYWSTLWRLLLSLALSLATLVLLIIIGAVIYATIAKATGKLPADI